ncbi:hypothetical protein C2G38_2119897 [Gigaspora rosea]|uniref:Uncharacterized protein n=1 Tax=Gigaspora rosea TaxID=44941 RepID=A0A397UBR4_9GLOM|nr:hypothetical protein C2G38_2119897 [Gigaspora rosea]
MQFGYLFGYNLLLIIWNEREDDAFVFLQSAAYLKILRCFSLFFFYTSCKNLIFGFNSVPICYIYYLHESILLSA